MEQYLSKNRMNRGLQKPMKTVFSGLTRLVSNCHRRATATMLQLTPAPPPAPISKKPLKAKYLAAFIHLFLFLESIVASDESKQMNISNTLRSGSTARIAARVLYCDLHAKSRSYKA
ncbi:MAG TPA: hypothetical protein VN289_24660 [Paraburkholderia sp.]|jgi:hypothetical protein|nr:hypothetical protein [Paraburkholderia sp.]